MTDLVLEIDILQESAVAETFDRNHEAGEMLDPGVGVVRHTGPPARFERAFAGNHRIVPVGCERLHLSVDSAGNHLGPLEHFPKVLWLL
jgi:hypothetical protein